MTTTIENNEVIPPQDESKNKRKRKFSKVKNVRSAYNLFYIDMKKKAGEKKIKSADVSAAWKEQDDKSYWQELAKKEKQRFLDDALSAGYTMEEIEERKGKKSKKKQKKNDDGDKTIKRPCNASLKYTNDHIKVVRENPSDVNPHELGLVLDCRWKKHVKTQKKKDENYEPSEGEEDTFKKEEAAKKVEFSPTEARVILGFRWKDMEDTDDVKAKYLKEAKDRYDEWVEAKEDVKNVTK